MRRIAFLISANMVPCAPGARNDVYEYERQFAALAPPCRARLMRLEPVVWDAPGEEWSAFDAVVIGTAWDYWDKHAEFLDTLDAVEAADTALFNPARLVRWNTDKGYLGELAARGAPSIPTLYRDDAGHETLAAAFDDLDADEIVVKPRVGASAYRLARLRRGAPLPEPEALPAGACLIQPFLASVAERGEVSLMYYDGVYSHAVHKQPKSGDFRVQSVYGATESVHDTTDEQNAAAAQILDAAGERFLYARVDLVEGPDGRPLVIELEVVEPYHYPEQGPHCGAHFAAALDRFLDGRNG